MNLGDICLKAFFAIVVGSFVVVVVVALFLRFRRCAWRTAMFAATLVWMVTGFIATVTGHQRLFVAWHQWQNSVLAGTACLTYDVEFSRLFATYRMSRDEIHESDGEPRRKTRQWPATSERHQKFGETHSIGPQRRLVRRLKNEHFGRSHRDSAAGSLAAGDSISFQPIDLHHYAVLDDNLDVTKAEIAKRFPDLCQHGIGISDAAFGIGPLE